MTGVLNTLDTLPGKQLALAIVSTVSPMRTRSRRPTELFRPLRCTRANPHVRPNLGIWRLFQRSGDGWERAAGHARSMSADWQAPPAHPRFGSEN